MAEKVDELGYVVLVFLFELSNNFELRESARAYFCVVLEGDFWKHDSGSVYSEPCGGMIRSQDLGADLTR